MSVVTVERKILEKNDEVANQNRRAFSEHGIFAINIVSSPGAGKTSLLEQTIERLKGNVTRGGCHLEAGLVREALQSIDLTTIKLLIIENVGNLVCPANYDLGEAVKVVVASTTEGDDKPLKYPAMFRNASVLVINKIDLLPYIKADLARLRKNALSINPSLTVFETSCTTGAGMDEWCAWLRGQAHGRS